MVRRYSETISAWAFSWAQARKPVGLVGNGSVGPRTQGFRLVPRALRRQVGLPACYSNLMLIGPS